MPVQNQFVDLNQIIKVLSNKWGQPVNNNRDYLETMDYHAYPDVKNYLQNLHQLQQLLLTKQAVTKEAVSLIGLNMLRHQMYRMLGYVWYQNYYDRDYHNSKDRLNQYADELHRYINDFVDGLNDSKTMKPYLNEINQSIDTLKKWYKNYTYSDYQDYLKMVMIDDMFIDEFDSNGAWSDAYFNHDDKESNALNTIETNLYQITSKYKMSNASNAEFNRIEKETY